jgi:hypothetical protein
LNTEGKTRQKTNAKEKDMGKNRKTKANEKYKDKKAKTECMWWWWWWWRHTLCRHLVDYPLLFVPRSRKRVRVRG